MFFFHNICFIDTLASSHCKVLPFCDYYAIPSASVDYPTTPFYVNISPLPMSNPYMYNSYQQYSPSMGEGQMSNTLPTFHNLQYLSDGNTAGSSVSSSTSSSVSSNYSLHNPRMRYYLSKSFDAEDDLEFCPDIPESLTLNSSPTFKKFNPYTALVFSPTANHGELPLSPNVPSSPRVLTPRIKKPIDIINPHTKVRVGSPAVQK